MLYVKQKALETFVITNEGLFKKVKGHYCYAVELFRKLNPSFKNITEKQMNHDLLRKAFTKNNVIKINKFKDSVSIRIYNEISFEQIKSLISNIEDVDTFVIRDKKDNVYFFNDKKSLNDFLLSNF